MATWHQERNSAGMAALYAPHPTLWKCVGDKPNQCAGAMLFKSQTDAETYCKNTGDLLIPPVMR